MAPGGAERIRDEARGAGAATDLTRLKELNEFELLVCAELENLETGGSDIGRELDLLVRTWGDAPSGGGLAPQQYAGGAIRMIQNYLPKGMALLVERSLRDAQKSRMPQPAGDGSDENDSDTSDEEGH